LSEAKADPMYHDLLADRRQRRWKLALILALTAPAAIVLYRANPATTSIYPSCPFRLITGLDCPGCGALRGLHQLLHGHLGAAWRLNPLLILALPVVGYGLLSDFAVVLRGRPLPRPALPAWTIWALLAVILAFWVLRNVG
jgi:hypothetical protein